jgi:hypothetical protein
LAGDRNRRRRLTDDEPLVINNLVLLLRWSNHASRTLPSTSDIEKLMNSVGGDSTYAPTGSVRDVYLQNSYNQLEMNSVVVPWLTCSKSESSAAGGASGLGSSNKLETCLDEALNNANTLYVCARALVKQCNSMHQHVQPSLGWLGVAGG